MGFSSFSRQVRFESSFKPIFQPKIAEEKLLVPTILKKIDNLVIFLEASHFTVPSCFLGGLRVVPKGNDWTEKKVKKLFASHIWQKTAFFFFLKNGIFLKNSKHEYLDSLSQMEGSKEPLKVDGCLFPLKKFTLTSN